MIVLAFVVLLTGLTVAFFSSSLLYRQISNSSASGTKVDLFAQGAVDTIVGDLKQEIAAGSNATLYTDSNGNVVGQVYRPFNANTAVPAQALKGSASAQAGVTSYAPNLVKRSAYTQNFFPAGSDPGSANYNSGNTSETISAAATPSASPPNAAAHVPSNRAANLATTTASQNGRSISLARWNKSLLLPKANPATDTDFTPINPANPPVAAASYTTPLAGTNEFVAPDWVLVARDGSNPTGAFNNNMVSSATGAASVVGRYAYTIYDEGGLLDANVAGYPKNSSLVPVGDPKVPPYKNVQAFADLTQLPGLGGGAMTAQRANVVINSLVGWRNFATAQPTSGTLATANFNFTGTPLTTFSTAMLGNTNGFLRTSNIALYKGQTDRMFASRQELMRLLLNGIAQQTQTSAAITDRANIQNVLQYLGTFSRDLNQPSYAPLPASLAPDMAHRPAVLAPASGGNSYGGLSPMQDDKINPAFLSVRVSKSLVGGRNDGSGFNVGEPLVKKRFALNRLVWLTYAGPIATSSTQYNPLVPVSYISALKSTYGFTDAFLQQGTAANIQKYFGLQWTVDGGSATGISDNQSKWFYNQHLSGGVAGPIMLLPDIAALANPREADFFEMLKASIAVGSLGKSFNAAKKEISVDDQIIQIGANIIDQYDLDGFPTRIIYSDNSNDPNRSREFAGVENVPYLYGYRTTNFRLQLSQPDTTNYYSGYDPNAGYVTDASGRACGVAGVVKNSPTSPTSSQASANAVPPMTKPGVTAITFLPDLWNPHDANSTRCALDSSGNPLVDASANPIFPTLFRVVAVSAGPPPAAPTAFAVYAQRGFDANRANAAENSDVDGAAAPFPIYASVSGQSAYGGFGPHSRKMTTANSGMYYTVPKTTVGAGLFRERTLLFRVGGAANLTGIDPTGGPSGVPENNVLLKPDPTTDGQFKDGALSFTSGSGAADGLLADPNLSAAEGYNSANEPQVGVTNKYLGIYIDSIPMGYSSTRRSDEVNGYRFVTMSQTTGATPITLLLQCWTPSSTGAFSAAQGQWVTYDQKPGILGPEQQINRHAQTGSMLPNDHISIFDVNCAYEFLDPRTGRLGPSYDGYPFPYLNGVSWLDAINGITYTGRPDYQSGEPYAGGDMAHGFYGSNRYQLFSQNRTDATDNGRIWAQDTTTNPPNPPFANYYADADGVVRRAMGAYVAPSGSSPASSTAPYFGLPQATASMVSGSGATVTITPTAQSQSRPFVLNRPFRSVMDLGNVFKGTPWKNLDFFTPESGDAALLDIFCINDTDDANGLVAGRVNLNTRQQPVLTAILSGGYKDEVKTLGTTSPTYSLPALTSNDANSVAGALLRRTGVTGSPRTLNNNPSHPLTNVIGLVGTWVSPQATSSGSSPSNIDGSRSYDGLSADLDFITFDANAPATKTIQRFRESALRPLANVGTTRVWNLMIDMVAQTGRYPLSASSLANFAVEGEQRYWIHLAIDRYTGKVIDKQIEVIKE